MRWTVVAGAFLWLACSVFAQDDAPKVEILTRTSVLDVGEKRVLYCQVKNLDESIPIVWISPNNEEVPEKRKGHPPPRVYVELKPMGDKRVLVLHFFPPSYDDNGLWTCKAGDYNQTCDIVVGHKFKLSVTKKDVYEDAGRTAVLKCEGFGAPEPVIHWYKENVLLDMADQSKYKMHKKGNITYSLEISNVDYQDAGTYMCKLTQKALSHYTNNTIKLVVFHKPVPCQEEPDAETDISRGTNLASMNEIYAIMDEEKNITCRVCAFPLPTFQWFKKNKKRNFEDPIKDEDRIFPGEDFLSSTLLLTMRGDDDVTQYRCNVANKKGTLNIMYDVNVAEKPPVPTSISFVTATTSSITFNVTCENCTLSSSSDENQEEDPGNLPVIGFDFELVIHVENYLAEWDSAELFHVPITNETNTLFEVGPLNNNTLYHVRVASVNKGGRSEWLHMEDPAQTSKAVKIIGTFLVLIAMCAYYF